MNQEQQTLYIPMGVKPEASVMMTTKDRHNLSMLDQLRFMVKFKKSHKHYPYRALPAWDEFPL
ncbi:hypothetical protein FHR92_004435 [Fontibacillus solani]|uniref:Uncharacterized protein n=1 Tax=Fontibacillus solani TaxID=1572857 RepID=A0A7W3SXB4_9BACL|nr:hypothetical protein [Fontibacillus solani]MBA9087942.1 hypothetical protein [Fontibacillus solani]